MNTGKKIILTVLFVSLIIVQTFADIYEVTAKKLNVRNGPGTYYEVLFTLSKGDEVKVISIDNNWSKIKFNGQTCYAFSKYLEPSHSTNNNTISELQKEHETKNKYLVLGTIVAVILLIIFFVYSGSRKQKNQTISDESNEAEKVEVESNSTVISESAEPKPPKQSTTQTITQSRVVVTKSTKSVGIAVLLVILFGPLGMFYSTIGGALFMTILAPIILFILFMTGNWGSLLLLAIIYYPICMIWAGNAASKYNQKIINQTRKSETS